MARTKRKPRRLTEARMILWDRGAQERFVEAVERISELAGQLNLTLHCLTEERKALQLEMATRRSEAAKRANQTRKQKALETGNGEALSASEFHEVVGQRMAEITGKISSYNTDAVPTYETQETTRHV